MEITKPRMPVILFSSSHMCERHHFLEALEVEWEEKYYKNKHFEFPSVNAIPGRKLNERFVDEFSTIVEELTERTALLLFLGDNNLSSKRNYELEKGSRQILNMVDEILNIHSNTEHLLAIHGLLPRWSHCPNQFRWHKKTDKRMFNLTSSYFEGPSGDRLGFVHTTGWYVEGSYLTQNWYERDGTHFNVLGARRLADRSLDSAQRLVVNWKQNERQD